MNAEIARWVDVRLGQNTDCVSREALLRCALDRIAAAGSPVLRATPIELEGEGGRCVIEVGGAAVDSALAEAAASLEGRVVLAPAEPRPDAEDAAAVLAGFTTEAIDHTADEAFAVEARDRADLLAAAAEALGALIVRPAGVRAERRVAVDVRAPEPAWPDDDRLFAWLAEVLYLLDSQRFALRRAVVFEDSDAGVRGALFGEPIDEGRHEVGGGIKAVTYHGMEITPLTGGGLRAQVIIDV
jgi:SHS2 domain-containing protein